MLHEMEEVSIRYSLSLEDGTPVVEVNLADAPYKYTPGQEEIMPILETALDGMKRGETREVVLSPTPDPSLKLDVSRLAFSLGVAEQTMVLRVEVL
jgi:FKBP-type peptidyl-prolyl cis-trans isomerase 2